MHRAPLSRRRVVQLAGVLLRQHDQFLHRLDPQRRMHHQPVGLARHLHDGREVLQRMERHLLVQIGNNHKGRPRREQRVSVGIRLGCDLGSNQAAGARPVVDYHLLAQDTGQPRRDDAHQHVRRAPRPKWNDHSNRFVGIGVGGNCGRTDRHAKRDQRCDTKQTSFHFYSSFPRTFDAKFDLSLAHDRLPLQADVTRLCVSQDEIWRVLPCARNVCIEPAERTAMAGTPCIPGCVGCVLRIACKTLESLPHAFR